VVDWLIGPAAVPQLGGQVAPLRAGHILIPRPLAFKTHPASILNPATLSAMSTKRVRGVSVFRPIIYGNTAVLLEGEEKETTDHTHRWTIGVRSANSPPLPAKKAADQVGGGDDMR